MANLTASQLQAIMNEHGVNTGTPYELKDNKGTVSVTLETNDPATGLPHKYPPVARIVVGDFNQWFPIHRRQSAVKDGKITKTCLGVFACARAFKATNGKVVNVGDTTVKVFSLAHQ